MTDCNTYVQAYAEIDNQVDGQLVLVNLSMLQLSLEAFFDCLMS